MEFPNIQWDFFTHLCIDFFLFLYLSQMTESLVIGIDLGITKSFVVSYVNGVFEVIADDESFHKIPSCAIMCCIQRCGTVN